MVGRDVTCLRTNEQKGPNAMNERIIFEAALGIADPKARRTFLDKACQSNPDVRARVVCYFFFARPFCRLLAHFASALLMGGVTVRR